MILLECSFQRQCLFKAWKMSEKNKIKRNKLRMAWAATLFSFNSHMYCEQSQSIECQINNARQLKAENYYSINSSLACSANDCVESNLVRKTRIWNEIFRNDKYLTVGICFSRKYSLFSSIFTSKPMKDQHLAMKTVPLHEKKTY